VRPKLLIVDDEGDARRLLDYNFTAAGFRVATAVSGETALRLAARLRPDIILLDIVLPDMDGFTVCRQLRAAAHTARTPVVMLSSHSGFSVQATGAEVGARRCLSKSAELSQIIAAVRLTWTEANPSHESKCNNGRLAVRARG
jgi:DNA-binding response OmpR family regulator